MTRLDRRTLRGLGLTAAERQAVRRSRLARAGRCLCGATLLPEWGIRCPECRAAAVTASRRYRTTPKGKRAGAEWKRAEYVSDPEAARQERRAKRAARKEAGQCQQCAEPIAQGSATYCERHRDLHRQHARKVQHDQRTETT